MKHGAGGCLPIVNVFGMFITEGICKGHVKPSSGVKVSAFILKPETAYGSFNTLMHLLNYSSKN